MFYVDPIQASISIGVMALAIYIHFRAPPQQWGEVTQDLIYHQVKFHGNFLTILGSKVFAPFGSEKIPRQVLVINPFIYLLIFQAPSDALLVPKPKEQLETHLLS